MVNLADGFFENWGSRVILEKPLIKRHGGIPKYSLSFGLHNSQKTFSDWYFKRNSQD
jgi:hypothetical protein